MNFEDYETLPTNCITTNMTAGAMAGIMEHCVMYPLDSVKTRMQSLLPSANGSCYRGVGEVLSQMVTKEGVLRPMRGISAVILGAGPAHALYFSSYEFLRDTVAQHTALNSTLSSGMAGCVSTLLHDGIMTPTDVIKQRLQMFNSPYSSIAECIRKVYGQEGFRAFYFSYTTQLVMNLPFQSLHFMTYEFCQSITNHERRYNPPAHMISGAIAGGIAAAITTPLDVCKTLLNTQQGQVKVTGLLEAVGVVYRLGGFLGFFRGLQARVLYQIPSTAICWSTYEFLKYVLNRSLTQKEEGVLIAVPKTPHLELASPSSLPSSSSSSSSSSSRTSSSSKQSSIRCELPITSSHHGVYNAYSLSTVHTSDNVTTNSMIDVRHR
ncbi:mitoferrin-1 [Planococcus citri]|uniref:mitoferrin-1 n=1 Tax=Planococcus citri TaxID=170843 RepID=UPI0031F7D329